jgi:hypothetical protein
MMRVAHSLNINYQKQRNYEKVSNGPGSSLNAVNDFLLE